METRVIKASSIAKRAMRKASRKRDISKDLKNKLKKQSRRNFKKYVYNRNIRLEQTSQNINEAKGLGPFLEQAIIATLIFGLLGTYKFEFTILAMASASFVLLALINKNSKDSNRSNPLKQNSGDLSRLIKRRELLYRPKRLQKRRLKSIDEQRSLLPTLPRIDLTSITKQEIGLSEFPYKNLRQ